MDIGLLAGQPVDENQLVFFPLLEVAQLDGEGVQQAPRTATGEIDIAVDQLRADEIGQRPRVSERHIAAHLNGRAGFLWRWRLGPPGGCAGQQPKQPHTAPNHDSLYTGRRTARLHPTIARRYSGNRVSEARTAFLFGLNKEQSCRNVNLSQDWWDPVGFCCCRCWQPPPTRSIATCVTPRRPRFQAHSCFANRGWSTPPPIPAPQIGRAHCTERTY